MGAFRIIGQVWVGIVCLSVSVLVHFNVCMFVCTCLCPVVHSYIPKYTSTFVGTM